MSSPAGPRPTPLGVPGTDEPGSDVIESLYRDSGRQSAALRRFEPALRPPEDADDYSWLYRPEPVPPTAPDAQPVAAAPVLPATPSSRAPVGRWLVPALLAGGASIAAVVGMLLGVV